MGKTFVNERCWNSSRCGRGWLAAWLTDKARNHQGTASPMVEFELLAMARQGK